MAQITRTASRPADAEAFPAFLATVNANLAAQFHAGASEREAFGLFYHLGLSADRAAGKIAASRIATGC